MLFRDRRKTSHEIISAQKRMKSSLAFEPLHGSRDTGAQAIDLQFQIDELRRVVAQLMDESCFHEVAYQHAGRGLLTFSIAGDIVDFNPKAATSLGIDRSGLVGRSFLSLLPSASQEAFRRHLDEALLSDGPMSCEFIVVDEEGKMREIELESVSWTSSENDLCYILSTVIDLKARKNLDRKLKEARSQADAAIEAKRQFIANISHEMRTPLAVILGFTDLLLEQNEFSVDEGRMALSAIHRNGFQLLHLIDDLLDLAKIEAGSMKMERSDVYVINEIEHILAEFKGEAQAKNVGLLYEAMTALPPKIVTDPVRFRQILVNIIGNAVKFTERGQVKVQLSLVPKTLEEDPGSFLHIDVTDTGCGISPDQFQLLFKPFSQVDASSTRRFGGTGLGLSLARRLGEGLGGGVQLLRSELDIGSTFRITIDPQVEINAIITNPSQMDDDLLMEEPTKAIDSNSLQGFKVLVVEDGEDNRLIISRLLKKAGALVECVEDGEEAIRAVARQSYDVILMDIQLPQMDGYEVTTKLRRQGCKTAVVALTAHTLIEDRVRAQRAGFDAFLSKPIDWIKLVGTLANFKTASSPVLH